MGLVGLQLMLFGLQGAASIFLGQHDEVDAAHEEVVSLCTAPCPRLSTSGLVGSISWRYMMTDEAPLGALLMNIRFRIYLELWRDHILLS